MENELIFLGLTALTPVYGALWYLIILGTKNKSNIDNIQLDLTELKNRFDSCKYCQKEIGAGIGADT